MASTLQAQTTIVILGVSVTIDTGRLILSSNTVFGPQNRIQLAEINYGKPASPNYLDFNYEPGINIPKLSGMGPSHFQIGWQRISGGINGFNPAAAQNEVYWGWRDGFGGGATTGGPITYYTGFGAGNVITDPDVTVGVRFPSLRYQSISVAAVASTFRLRIYAYYLDK